MAESSAQSQMPQLVMPEADYAVLVSNISPQATEKELKDFFSFCGYIRGISLFQDGDMQKAVLQFWEESSVATAILLSNALIRDVSIKVENHDLSDSERESLGDLATPDINFDDMELPPDVDGVIFVDEAAREPKVNIIAKLMANGYVLASDTGMQARSWDDSHVNIRGHIVAAGEAAKQAAIDIDNKYEISIKTGAVYGVGKDVAGGVAKDLNAKLGITEKATMAKDIALANKQVNKGLGVLGAAKVAAMTKATALKEETNKRIEEKRAEQAALEEQRAVEEGGEEPLEFNKSVDENDSVPEEAATTEQ